MAARDSLHLSSRYTTDYFSLAWKQDRNTVTLIYQSGTHHLTTESLPNTVWLLQYHLPSMINHKCMNDEDLPFIKEAANTEIAHLFEHILIECICREYFLLGDKSVVAKGVTRWHTASFQEGRFYIDIEVSSLSETIFRSALARAVQLMKIILASNAGTPTNPALQSDRPVQDQL